MATLQVLISIDCERIAAESPTGGPETWELSEASIRGYCDRLLDQGYKPVLFLVPECASQHPDLLAKLAERGTELGLHFHPQSLGDHHYQRYLGEYDAVTQREIISLATEMLTKVIGKRPVSIRIGNHSASDDTYGVLYDLGFRQGSMSDPGRYVPQYAAVWRGAYPDPHHVDPRDKLRAGDLPFLDVPVTTDPDRLQPSGFPYELRIESGPFATWHRPIIDKQLQRFVREQVGFPALCIFTHNYFPYHQPDYVGSRTLQDMLDFLAHLAPSWDIVPVTLKEAHERYKAYLAKTQA